MKEDALLSERLVYDHLLQREKSLGVPYYSRIKGTLTQI